jgi:beta-glucosidase/6-phospho-beta-glucosidase/beta-galactosidase
MPSRPSRPRPTNRSRLAADGGDGGGPRRGANSAARIDVTENGSAWPDEVLPDGQIEDKERTSDLEEHLAAGERATRGGAPLAHVDDATEQRTIKLSGYRYADIIRRHKLELTGAKVKFP